MQQGRTAELTKQLASLNHFKYAIIGTTSSRIIGVAAIPLAALADVFAHAALAAGKIMVGVIISPYNTFAVLLFPAKAASRDLEFSSALIHLIRVVDSLFAGVTLPFICLLSPDRAYQYANRQAVKQKSIAVSDVEIALNKKNLQQEILAEIGQNASPKVISRLIKKIERLELDAQAKDAACSELQIEAEQLKLKIGELEARPSPNMASPTVTTEETISSSKEKEALILGEITNKTTNSSKPEPISSKRTKPFDPSKPHPCHNKILGEATQVGKFGLQRLKTELDEEIIEKLESGEKEEVEEALDHKYVQLLTKEVRGLTNDQIRAYFENLYEEVKKIKI